MKTFEALYIDENGVVRYIAECPEEPKVCMAYVINSCLYDVCKCHDDQKAYERALAAAKQSAIEFSDPPFAISVLQDADLEIVRDKVYPLPTGWKVEVKPGNICLNCGEPNCVSLLCFDSDGHAGYEQVAILTPDHIPDSGEKVESQEELWNDAESVVSDELTRYYSDLPSDQLAFNIAEALKEKYLLTRKP